MTVMKKSGRGGYREGSGRKRLEGPGGEKRDATLASVSLTRSKLEAYRQEAIARGMTLTDLVETSLDYVISEKIDIAR
jgi:hypothetical protein